jgi:hypothetical protein
MAVGAGIAIVGALVSLTRGARPPRIIALEAAGTKAVASISGSTDA